MRIHGTPALLTPLMNLQRAHCTIAARYIPITVTDQFRYRGSDPVQRAQAGTRHASTQVLPGRELPRYCGHRYCWFLLFCTDCSPSEGCSPAASKGQLGHLHIRLIDTPPAADAPTRAARSAAPNRTCWCDRRERLVRRGGPPRRRRVGAVGGTSVPLSCYRDKMNTAEQQG